jgi:xanthine dehydrogenase/oxidase
VFLGATVLFALREALKSARTDNNVTEKLVLDSPATAERLRLLVGDELLKRVMVKPEEGEKSFFVKVE